MMMGALFSPFFRAPELAFSFGLGLMTGVLNWLSGKIEPLGLLISVHSRLSQRGVCAAWLPLAPQLTVTLVFFLGGGGGNPLRLFHAPLHRVRSAHMLPAHGPVRHHLVTSGYVQPPCAVRTPPPMKNTPLTWSHVSFIC